ncbi:MAG: S8 family serine peptidase [Muribaculaceae bacterium]|nr:S8 family serine peptidase [Muribaculaceae bacterium]
MRKFILILMAISLSLGMIAQNKLSAPTRVYLQQRAAGVAQNPDGKNALVSPKSMNGVECVECFISLNGVSIAELEANGVKVTGKFSDFVTASIPVNKIEAVARIKGVKQVGIARNARLLTDVAKGIVNADKAWDGTNYGLPQGYTGQGVVVGLIDDGIQFNHRAFLDDNGNTRVKAVYLPNASSANGGTTVSIDGVQMMGYQYTTPSQIANLTCDDSNESHGTHTTGCAAGSHVGNYAGMAPEADLILCGCGSQLTETAIISSAKYIGWYAQQLGKPCVISISLGSDIGPHDGMSMTSRAYTEVANTYGAVILLAAGNEADIYGHARKTLSSNDDYMAVTNNVSGGWWGGSATGSCDIWNSTSDELQVKVIVSGSQSDWMTNGTFGSVTVQGGVDVANNRYELYIESSASQATYVIKGSAGNTISVYTDCYYSTLSSSSSSVSGYTITPGTYEGSMCDDMTSPKVISVGAQASRSSDGYGQGDVAYFSSYGVDCNGVNQPFITAPGHYVISSINGYDYYQSSSWSMTYNGQTYNWGQMSGTSMATPCAAGVVALYLQADPTLDVDRVKEVIAETATAYPAGSSSPVMARGHGIINALDGIEYILQHQGPTIIAKPSEITFEGYAGETYTQTITVKGYNLTQNINIAKSGSNVYSVSPTSITPADAESGVQVTVTYAPTAAGETQATLTLTSAEAETQTVTINGVAQPRVPTILTDPEALNFNAKLSTPMTKTVKVNGLFLTNDITVTLNDQNGVFTVSPTTISMNSTGIDTPVEVNVTFTSDVEAEYTGSLTFTSNGAVTKSVALTAKATDKGTAADPYLDIAKYETIDDAGAAVSGMSTIYKYTEYVDDECAWLTVSNYGALKTDATQNWFTCEGEAKTGSESWGAVDVFVGSTSYFSSNAYYTDWNEDYMTFYVTNCSQVKQYAENRSNTSYPLVMSIYECTLNADGTITPSSTAVQTIQNTTTSKEVIASNALDPEKIYKIAIFNDYSKLYEIAFKTPINGLESPVATDATLVGPTYFTANWNPVLGADSYILRVIPKNYDILTEGFSKFTKQGAQDISSQLDNFMDNAGWTGSRIYETVGGARLGTASYPGSLTSPGLTLTENKVTVSFKAKTFNNDTDCNLKVSCGSATQTVTLPDNNEAIYTVVLDCNAAANQKISFETTAGGKRAIITSIHIIDGERAGASRSIDLDGVTFTGITTNSYKVVDLDPATVYFYDVKAVFGAKASNWSNKIMVTTLAGGIFGDVNCDGEVTTVDITCLYNYLLNGDETYIATSDVDGDGFITTTDITVIYNILLGSKK